MELATVIKYSEELDNARDEFKLLPNGVYEAILQIKGIQNTKDGTYLQCCWEVVKPPKGGYSKYVWQNLFIYGKENVLSYSKRYINSLMKCVGITELKDTDQLDGAIANITISTEKGKEGYKDRNRIDRIEEVKLDYTKGSDAVRKIKSVFTSNNIKETKTTESYDLPNEDFTAIMDKMREAQENDKNDNIPF